MPNYITHAVMGDVVEVPNSRIKIDKNLLRIFSLGSDLMFSEKGAINIVHNSNTCDFFKAIVDYIKENKQMDNEQIMEYLYGHIMHYELDRKAHPYINYMTLDVPKSQIINFHMAAEEYLGDVILKNKLKISRSDYSGECYRLFSLDEDDKLRELIDQTYSSIYGEDNYYGITIKTLAYLSALNLLRNGLDRISPDLYFKLIGLNHYLKEAKMTRETLENTQHECWHNPISQEKSFTSFEEIFDSAVESATSKMEDVDKIIYDGQSFDKMDVLFDNSSYDTGIDCEIGMPFVQSRYKVLQKKLEQK